MITPKYEAQPPPACHAVKIVLGVRRSEAQSEVALGAAVGSRRSVRRHSFLDIHCGVRRESELPPDD